MKPLFLGLLALAVLLVGCGQPTGPKNSSAPLPSQPKISTLRLNVENRIQHRVSLEPIVGFRAGGSLSLGPPEKLQMGKVKTSSKAIDLRLFDAPTDTSTRTVGDVYLVHVMVATDGESANGPESYVAIPTRIAENAGAKGGQMRIEDKGISLTVGGVTLYGAWIPPSE